MAWCCQAISHYLSHYWARSLSPCGVTRPQSRLDSDLTKVHVDPIGITPALVSGNGLARSKRHAIIWSNDAPIHRRIFASLKYVFTQTGQHFGNDIFKLIFHENYCVTVFTTSLVHRSRNGYNSIQNQHHDVMKWKHFRVTGHLCGEFTGHRWIPRTKATDAKLWYFPWSAPEWTVEAGYLRRHRVHHDVTVMDSYHLTFACHVIFNICDTATVNQ